MESGIAHEIRNPLTTIQRFVQLLQKEVDKPLYVNTMMSEILICRLFSVIVIKLNNYSFRL
ncbi:histidine kinase dimerization/phospho-acceptor domain-containing protein [Neobacillus sp. PS3-12]|uniref:histidine kinase dimerization/phospho-acceptor domain-containing protein n=1 Tax=Neobacillus sp. PS3-12 TaxID=3070677 RepID=UPI0035A8AB70